MLNPGAGRYTAAAVAACTIALELNPRSTPAWGNLAKIHATKENWDAARKAFMSPIS